MENRSRLFQKKEGLFKSSSVVFIGMIGFHVLNYLFQITMGRMLSVQTFGEMNALFSMMVILSVPFTSITTYVVKNISYYSALDRNKEANNFIIKNYRNLLIVGVGIVSVGVFFSGYISESLKIKDILPVLLLLLYIFFSVVIPVNYGVLQGLQMFKMYSFLNTGSGFLKYVICVILVAIGLGLNGVMIGIILSLIITGYISFIPVKKQLRLGRHPVSNGNSYLLIIPIFIANLAYSMFTQIDIVLVKHFFSPHEAGIYSSAAVIGKIVLYLPMAIGISMFPMVASSKAKGEVTLHLALKALFLTLLLSTGSAIIIYIFPDAIVSIFFGNRFISAAPIIGLFAIVMLPMAIIMILVSYNLAKGKKFFAYMMLLCSVIQIAGIINFHNSLVSVLKVTLFTGLFCMAILFLLLAFEYYKDRLYNFGSSLISSK